MRRPGTPREAVPRGGGAQLGEAVAIGPWAQHGEREIEHRRAHAKGVGVIGADHHAVAGGQVTRRGQAALAFDMDEAGAAGAERRPIRILAELGQRDAETVHGIEHRRARRHVDRGSIDDDFQTHLLMPPVQSGVVIIASTLLGIRRGSREC
jgi:hypothetical protein